MGNSQDEPVAILLTIDAVVIRLHPCDPVRSGFLCLEEIVFLSNVERASRSFCKVDATSHRILHRNGDRFPLERRTSVPLVL